MALDIKKILKGLRILNDSDSTKALELSVSGSTNTKTTVTTSQTANRTITLPDATDTLVGKDTTDVLSNKSIDADTNTITNIENADIKSGAAIDATKIANGTVDNTEFQYLNGVTSAVQTQLNAKENSSNKGIANGYASLDSNGLVPTTQMPPAALERLVVVADQTARFALTTATVQNGDTVYQNDTTTMYFVKDDTNLSNSSGYTIYSAGTSVNFSGSLAGDIAGTQGATTYNNVVPVAKGGTNSSTALGNNKVIVSTAGAIVESSVSTTTLGYLDATSSVQTQLDGKIAKSLVTTTGDMIYASGASTPARLPVGGSGQVLKSVGGLPTWATFSGGINYLSSNSDAEADTAGWATYADAAGTSPVDGTGGSPSSTFTRSTSSPLRGTASFLWTKSAANRQGEGFSYDFTIDASDKAKVLQISFDYLVSSGTYADSDMTIWIYDVTNAALIQPAGYTIQNATVSMSQKATFQSASNSTSYRLIVHTASTSASAYTLKFDNFAVGPQIVTNGAAITDWVTYTPTVTGFGTLASQQVQSRRVGDSLEVRGVLVTGTPTAVTASVTLGFNGINNNVTADTSKIGGGGYSPNTSIGTAWEQGNTATFFGIQPILSSNTICFGSQTSTANPTTINTGSALIGSASTITFSISVPIVGWSSNVQLSSDTDTRVVAAKYTGNDGASLSGTPVVVKGMTLAYDTHSFINLTTGAITIPVSGKYEFTCQAGCNALSTAANQYFLIELRTGSTANAGTVKDSTYQRLANSCYVGTPTISYSLDCIAGEVYSFQAASDVGASRALQGGFIAVKRLSGPSVIAASESVHARYGGSTTTLTNSTTVDVTFTTKEKDTHNAFNGTTFTVPVSGTYQVVMGLETAAFTAGSVGAACQAIITKNGSDHSKTTTAAMTTSSVPYAPIVTALISCIAGDTLKGRFYHNLGATPTLNNQTYSCYISFTRVGN